MRLLILAVAMLGLLIPMGAASADVVGAGPAAGVLAAAVPAADLVGGTSWIWCALAGVGTGVAVLTGQWLAAAGFFIGAGSAGCI